MNLKKVRKQMIVTLSLAFLSMAAIVSSQKTAAAQEVTTPEITDESLFDIEYVDGVLTITGFHQPTSGQNINDIIAPAAYHGQKIRAIGKGAFAGAGNIHNLYLPDSLEIISDEAFSSYHVDNMGSYTYTATGEFAMVESAGAETVFVETPVVETNSIAVAPTLPSKLTYIGYQAFYNSPIKNILFNSKNLVIGNSAFENTGNLLDVTLCDGASITSIGSNAFKNSGIHNFFVNGSIGSIGDSAFTGTANIDKFEVGATGNINVLGNSIFENSGIHYVTLYGEIASIGDRAFAGCGNILEVSVDSTTPYTLGEYAFNNAGIHKVDLSNGLGIVEKGTFEGCGNLETVYLPDTVTHIEDDAFKNVSNIKQITISDNATVAPDAFAGASGSTLSALATTNNTNIKTAIGIATPTPVPTPVVTPAPTPIVTPAPEPEVIKVASVKLKKAKKKGKKVTLKWTKNKDASGYTIYKKVVKKGTKAKKAKKIKFKKVKNVSAKKLKLTLKLKKKTTTQFYVKAFVKSTVDGKTVTTYSKASNTKKVVMK